MTLEVGDNLTVLDVDEDGTVTLGDDDGRKFYIPPAPNTDFTDIEPGSTDWNTLEELVKRLGADAVINAAQTIHEQP